MQIAEDEIKHAIHFARSQALLQGKNLVLSHLPDTNDWSAGMLLFTDNASHQHEPGATLIHEWHWQHRGIHITWQGFQSNEHLLFASDIRHSALNGYFLIQSNTQQRKIIINRLGRIKQ